MALRCSPWYMTLFSCNKLLPDSSGPLQTWKNPVTGALHFQVHPCAVQELLIDPLPKGASRDGALYPDGARLTDLKEVRDLLYKMQRPAIAPNVRFSFSDHHSPFLAYPFVSWCIRMIGRKRTSSCSIIVACCTRSLARLGQTRCAHSTSATLPRRMIPRDLRPKT